MRLFYGFLFVFMLLPFTYGQEVMNEQNIDVSRLEKALGLELNQLRDTACLGKLDSDLALFKAAFHHSKYCAKSESIKHYQKSTKNKTVASRVVNNGGRHGFVNEVITKLTLKGIGLTTYEKVARDIFLKSLKAPKNKRAFLMRGLALQGISVQMKGDVIYAVFVLGSAVVFPEEYTTPANLYGINGITYKNQFTCDECRKKFNKMPSEISYDIFEKEGEVYFVMSDQKWFNIIFANKNDGISVDVIRKSQYTCGIPNVTSGSNLYNGYVLPPVFAKDFSKVATVSKDGEVIVPLGKIPDEWLDEPFELNLMILQKKVLCRYNTYFRVPFDSWELLNLGLDLSITNEHGESVHESEKEMNFTVPFKKGKYTFDSLDIKPLADSLRLTDFTISMVDINAYASIEGTEEINLNLQKKRAESILDAFRTYNSSEIKTSINTSENWVEFFRDAPGTKLGFLVNKNKEEIRDYINNHLNSETENLLSPHRKATIKIKLKRRGDVKKVTMQMIDDEIALLTEINDLDKYYLISKIMFQKGSVIEKEKLLSYLYSKVEEDSLWLPEAKANIAVQRFVLDSTLIEKTIRTLKEFKKYHDQISSVHYNLTLLEIVKWGKQGVSPPPVGLKESILNVEHVSAKEKNRLLLNYLILETAYLYEAKRYKEKDEVIREVLRIVSKSELNDQETFLMARFFADYQKYREAVSILKPFISDINVSEDLLFLYINLTIVDEAIVRRSEYRTALTNASQSNKERFCKLFSSSSSGGITFQLLDNKYLKRTYCEQCD